MCAHARALRAFAVGQRFQEWGMELLRYPARAYGLVTGEWASESNCWIT